MTTKRKSKIKTYEVDLGFYSIDFKIKAKTAGEAKRKAFEKMKKLGYKKLVNPHTTFAGISDF